MPRLNSSNWSVNDAITAARLQDYNEEIDDIYVYGDDRGRIRSAASATPLRIDIAAFNYRVGGSSGQYAGGTDITVVNTATNYVEVDTSGVIQINQVGWTTTYGRLGTVTCSGGVITAISIWKPDVVGGSLGGATTITVMEKTSDYTILSGDIGKIITNRGASGRVILTLPALSGSQGFYITITCAADQFLCLRAQSGEVISDGGIRGNAFRSWQTRQNYSQIYLYASYTDQWIIGFKSGYWHPAYADAWDGTTNGYLCGGFIAAASAIISKVTYSSEAEASLGITLDTARSESFGLNAPLKGYISGGWTGAVSAVISALTYSGETEANIAATLDTARRYHASTGWSWGEAKGYNVGGNDGNPLQTIEETDFSSEASAAITARIFALKVSNKGINQCAACYTSEAGYTIGGYNGTSAEESMTVMNFASKVVTTYQNVLTGSTFTNGAGGVQKLDELMYFCGFDVGSTTIFKTVVPEIAIAAISGTLNSGRTNTGNLTNGITKGYVCGGTANKIDDIVFSNDTSTELAATLDTNRYDIAGISDNC